MVAAVIAVVMQVLPIGVDVAGTVATGVEAEDMCCWHCRCSRCYEAKLDTILLFIMYESDPY